MSPAAIPLEIIRALGIPLPNWNKATTDSIPDDEANAWTGWADEIRRAATLEGKAVLSEQDEQELIRFAERRMARGETLDWETGQWINKGNAIYSQPIGPVGYGDNPAALRNPSAKINNAYQPAINPAQSKSPSQTMPLAGTFGRDLIRGAIEVPPARFAPPTRIPPPPIIPAATPTSTPPPTTQDIRQTNLPLGQLLQDPFTTKPYPITVIDRDAHKQQFEEEQKKAFDSFKDFMKARNPTSITDGSVVTINPPQTQSRDKDKAPAPTTIYGQTGITNFTNNYAERAKTALLPTIASIPIIPAIAKAPPRRLAKAPVKTALKNPSLPSKFNRKLDEIKGMLDLGKLIDLLNLAMSFHNVAMLSTDVARSLGSIIDNVLTLFGLDTSGDKSVASFVSKQLDTLLNYVLGAETVKDIKLKFAKVSAIYTSATNLLNTVQSMQSSTASILEATGSYVGKIGNALKRVGAVHENAYSWMSESMSARDARLAKLTNFIEKGQEITSNLEMITGEAVSIKDNIKQLQEDKKEFDKSIAEAKPVFLPDNKPIKEAMEKGKVTD